MTDTREWVKSLRKETGKTQKVFAEYYEIPLRTLEDWERGISHPPEYVLRLLEYKIRMEALLKDKGDMDTNGGIYHGNNEEG